MGTSSNDLREAITRLDRALVQLGASDETRADWVLVRGEVRMRRQQSERSLPAVATAVQQAYALRHLVPESLKPQVDEIVDALSKIPSAPPEDTR